MIIHTRFVQQGLLAQKKGDLQQARMFYLKAIQNNLDCEAALQLLATLEHQQGNHQAALNYFLRSKPKMAGHTFWHINYANLLRDMKNYPAAKQSYQQALNLDKTFEPAWNGLGAIAQLEKNQNELISIYEKALTALPNNETIHCNLARVYLNHDQYEKAELVIKKGLELAKINQNKRLIELLTYDGVRVMEYNKQNPDVILNTLLPKISELHTEYAGRLALKTAILQLKTQRWEGIGTSIQIVHARIGAGENAHEVWGALSLPGLNESIHSKMARRRAETRQAKLIKPLLLPDGIPNLYGRRLRIGLLSGDLLHPHPVFNALIKTLELLSPQNVSLYLYSTYPGPVKEQKQVSSQRQCISAYVRSLHDVANFKDVELAKLIHQERIDVLLDLTGHTKHDHMGVLPYRPAPLVVNWLGYPGTTGSKYHDYILGDRYVTPENCQPDYAEKIWQMPHTFFPTDNTRPLPEAPPKTSVGLPEDKLIFACFSNGYKINPPVFTAWCEILRNTPDSILWLRKPKSADPKNLLAEAKRRNIDPERIVFAERVPSMVDHWARTRLADLALDTTPYNMHATAVDFLWAGVPVLTVKGQTFAGRVGESLLNAANMPDMVAKDWQDYINKAVYLANNPEALKKLKTRVWQAKTESPLFDTEQMARDLEDAFIAMYEKAVENKK